MDEATPPPPPPQPLPPHVAVVVVVAPLGESLAQLTLRRGGDYTIDGGVGGVGGVDWWHDRVSDSLLNRCLWPESGDMLEGFAAAHPHSTVLHLLWRAHCTYQAGGPHALWTFAQQQRPERVGSLLTAYLLRVHRYHVRDTILEPRHAAFFEAPDAEGTAPWSAPATSFLSSGTTK